MLSYIKHNLNTVINSITSATLESSRAPDSVKLLAVSKTFPREAVLGAYKYGQRHFGENRMQEFQVKVPSLPNDIEWHFIGHLQGNKVNKAVELADYIHSVDSLKLIKRIDTIAKEKERRPKILLELNVSGEKSKFGLRPDQIEECARIAAQCKNLELVGLMTMAPYNAAESVLRRVFALLRQTRDELQQKLNIRLPELSMGMSSDYKIAISEGATIVRIGTSIFGKRNFSIQ
jgi:PLP dependent protein